MLFAACARYICMCCLRNYLKKTFAILGCYVGAPKRSGGSLNLLGELLWNLVVQSAPKVVQWNSL